MEDLKTTILGHLNANHRGRGRAIKAVDLGILFAVDLRTINEIIRQLRKDGKLIGSSKVPPFGYYVPATENEARQYLKCFRDEVFDMLQTLNRQKRAQRMFLSQPKQPELFPLEAA